MHLLPQEVLQLVVHRQEAPMLEVPPQLVVILSVLHSLLLDLWVVPHPHQVAPPTSAPATVSIPHLALKQLYYLPSPVMQAPALSFRPLQRLYLVSQPHNPFYVKFILFYFD